MFLWVVLLTGCDRRPVASAGHDSSTEAEVSPAELAEQERRNAQLAARLAAKRRENQAAQTTATPAREPGAEEQRCFQCEARGTVACVADQCDRGHLPCPGPCIRPGKGTWIPDPHHPGQLGYKLPLTGRSYALVSLGHAGEVFTVQNGQAVPLGPCPTCQGRTRVPCKTCQGTGRVTCPVCERAGIVAAAWKPTDNPWFNRQPDVVRLKDGRVFLAREAGGGGDTVIFKTRDGQFITVKRAEVQQMPRPL